MHSFQFPIPVHVHFCSFALDCAARYSRCMLPDVSVYTHSPLGDDEVPREFFTAQFYHCKHLAVRVRGGGDGRWVMVGGWVSLTVGLGRLLIILLVKHV